MVHDLAAVILAGGRSSRLGTFKPIVKLAGRPLISYAIEIAVFTSKPYVLVSSHEQSEMIRGVIGERRATIINEPKETVRPFRFIAALSTIPEDLIFLMGCDTPFLDPRLPTLLLQHIGDSSAVVPVWSNGYLEPLAALYRKEPLSEINSATSFREILAKIDAKTVSIETLGVRPESFFNINTPSDLRKAQTMLRNKNKP